MIGDKLRINVLQFSLIAVLLFCAALSFTGISQSKKLKTTSAELTNAKSQIENQSNEIARLNQTITDKDAAKQFLQIQNENAAANQDQECQALVRASLNASRVLPLPPPKPIIKSQTSNQTLKVKEPSDATLIENPSLSYSCPDPELYSLHDITKTFDDNSNN